MVTSLIFLCSQSFSTILFCIVPAISGVQTFWKPDSFSLEFFMRVMGEYVVAAFLSDNSNNFKWLEIYPQAHAHILKFL